METPASPRSLAAYQAAVASLPFGKSLPGAVYHLDDPEFSVPAPLRTIADRLRARLALGPEFNVLKGISKNLRVPPACRQAGEPSHGRQGAKR